MSIRDIPDEFVGETSQLVDAFVLAAESEGEARAKALALFEPLPRVVKSSLAFYDNLTKRWRYDFG